MISGSWDGYVRAWKISADKRRVEPLGALGVVAERQATEYTRFLHVNFWDIAGGHSIAKYAGLDVLQPGTGHEIDYTDPNMRVKGYSLKWRK